MQIDEKTLIAVSEILKLISKKIEKALDEPEALNFSMLDISELTI